MSLESWKQTTEDVEERLHKQGALISGSLAALGTLASLGLDLTLFDRPEKIKKAWKQGDKSAMAANIGQLALSAVPIAGSSAVKWGHKGLQGLKAAKGLKKAKALKAAGNKSAARGAIQSGRAAKSAKKAGTPWSRRIGVAEGATLGAGVAGGYTGNKFLQGAGNLNPQYAGTKWLEDKTPDLHQDVQYDPYRAHYPHYLSSLQKSKSGSGQQTGSDRTFSSGGSQNDTGRYEINPVPEESSDQSGSGIASWFRSGSSSGQAPEITTEPNLYQKYVLDQNQQV